MLSASLISPFSFLFDCLVTSIIKAQAQHGRSHLPTVLCDNQVGVAVATTQSGQRTIYAKPKRCWQPQYRVFPFESTAEALRYVEQGRSKGKVTLKIK
ncbi:hypothetical protein TU86_20470 [Pseudomonas weihenstephanensis]|uniref:Uncharacterized protein n=1 Tax=Pseudomonas weihenstephanensis TaxID=1608994 RepID=A0A0J6II52_9PSED|nr:hypothetical protein TU86_20470 [Pseudomonas weihenstephanensis]